MQIINGFPLSWNMLFVAGGSGTPTTVNTIEYVNMASTGNGQDFGDLTKKVSATNGLSDCHGGLGGF